MSSSPVLRWFLAIAGGCALVVGAVGVVVPLLPTTPFLLLAAVAVGVTLHLLHLKTVPRSATRPPLQIDGRSISLSNPVQEPDEEGAQLPMG